MGKRTLKGHAYMQAYIETYDDGNREVLVSYATGVVFKFNTSALEKEFQGRPLNAISAYLCTGLYSNTTIKHISLYCRENGISYYDLKLIANTDWWLLIVPDENPYKLAYYNPHTGEVVRLLVGQKPSYYKKARKYMIDNEYRK